MVGGAQSTKSKADGVSFPYILEPGNGGSGGQGYVGGQASSGGIAEVDGSPSSTGPSGVDGTRAAPGSLAGISGGAFGEYGGAQLTAAPGYAILASGNNVTIIGDNNLTNKRS